MKHKWIEMHESRHSVCAHCSCLRIDRGFGPPGYSRYFLTNFIYSREPECFDAASLHIELIIAEDKHPDFPKDRIHMLAVMIEEAGEAMKAALEIDEGKSTLEDLKKELAQTGAMCLRILKALNA